MWPSEWDLVRIRATAQSLGRHKRIERSKKIKHLKKTIVKSKKHVLRFTIGLYLYRDPDILNHKLSIFFPLFTLVTVCVWKKNLPNLAAILRFTQNRRNSMRIWMSIDHQLLRYFKWVLVKSPEWIFELIESCSCKIRL